MDSQVSSPEHTNRKKKNIYIYFKADLSVFHWPIIGKWASLNLIALTLVGWQNGENCGST